MCLDETLTTIRQPEWDQVRHADEPMMRRAIIDHMALEDRYMFASALMASRKPPLWDSELLSID